MYVCISKALVFSRTGLIMHSPGGTGSRRKAIFHLELTGKLAV